MNGHDSIMGSDTEAHSGSTPQPPIQTMQTWVRLSVKTG